MLTLEAQLVFYNPNTTKLNKDFFSNYIHVKGDEYWAYAEKTCRDRDSLYTLDLKPFDEYKMEDYDIWTQFHIILDDIEERSFGYRINLSIGLLPLKLYEFGHGWYPLRSKKWISINNQNLKPHQIQQLKEFLNEKNELKYTRYVINFGKEPALFISEIKVDTLAEANKAEYGFENQDYPREIGEVSLLGDLHFKNIRIAEKEAKEKVSEYYENAAFLKPLDENAIFE